MATRKDCEMNGDFAIQATRESATIRFVRVVKNVKQR
jgi:hypothetical protein